MASRPDPRLGDWLDIVGDLLRDAAVALPVDQLAGGLMDSFALSGVSWSESLRPDRYRIFPESVGTDLPVLDWVRTGRLHMHPLLKWFATTNDPRAQSTQRIPGSVVPARAVRAWSEVTQPYGIAHELSMPLQLDGPRHRAFVLARSEEDFSDLDLALARRLQPVLAGVDRHIGVFAEHPPAMPLDRHHITARELAVLSLLSTGLTATSIARRLGISPRTVHKHLEHVYAKLSVRDKVSAVRRAQLAGILPRP